MADNRRCILVSNGDGNRSLLLPSTLPFSGSDFDVVDFSLFSFNIMCCICVCIQNEIQNKKIKQNTKQIKLKTNKRCCCLLF